MAEFPVAFFTSSKVKSFDYLGMATVEDGVVTKVEALPRVIQEATDTAGILGRIRFAKPNHEGFPLKGGRYAYLLWVVRDIKNLNTKVDPADLKDDEMLPFFGVVDSLQPQSMTALSRFDRRYDAVGIMAAAEHAKFRYAEQLQFLKDALADPDLEPEDLPYLLQTRALRDLKFIKLGAKPSVGAVLDLDETRTVGTIDIDFVDASQLRVTPAPMETVFGNHVAAKGKILTDDKLQRLRTDIYGRA